MQKAKYRELAGNLEREIKRYELYLERLYNVGDPLTRDEIQWMKNFSNPESNVQGIYKQLTRIDDPFIDMIISRFDALRRKEHGLKQIQKIRESSVHRDISGAPKQDNAEEFFSQRHKDADRLVSDLIFAIHRKSGGISPAVMDRFVDQIRKKIDTIKINNQDSNISVKAAVNKSTNQIEIIVDSDEKN
jgi:hypothetical protein